MHMIDNAGEGDERLGCTALTFKGSPNGRRRKYEIEACDPRVPMLFQKNVWADTVAMTEIARKILQVKKDRFGDMSVLMTLENLAARCAIEVKKRATKVMCFFVTHRKKL